MSTLHQEISELIRSAQLLPHDILSGRNRDEYVKKLLKQAELVTLFSSGQLQALVAFYANDPNLDCAFISMVVVSPGRQRQGLAKSLIESALTSIALRGFRKCRLEVHPCNTGATALYRSLGFNEVSNTDTTRIMEVGFPRPGSI